MSYQKNGLLVNNDDIANAAKAHQNIASWQFLNIIAVRPMMRIFRRVYWPVDQFVQMLPGIPLVQLGSSPLQVRQLKLSLDTST